MKKYKEVPEWCYLIVLVIAAVCGMVGVGVYPTHVTPAVVVFGILMPLIVMIPCGLIQAVSGLPIPLNVIAEFIGGAIVPGNANSLIYFKTYGYIATYQALAFSSDLKLAHYLKIPPWHTFTMQIWATIIYCFVCAGLQNFVLAFKDVCTAEAKFQMACPGANTFFTSAVFWGTLGPARLFGPGKRYNLMLLGFPVGVVLVLGELLNLFPGPALTSSALGSPQEVSSLRVASSVPPCHVVCRSRLLGPSPQHVLLPRQRLRHPPFVHLHS